MPFFFVVLTSKSSGDRVYVNLALVSYMRSSPSGGTELFFPNDNEPMRVTEDISEIVGQQ